MLDTPGLTPGRRHRFQDCRARIAELLPLAARLGMPVLAGTDVTGSTPREVALGLEPEQALAAAATADIVNYHHDPRQDPGHLARPAAVVVAGMRLR